MRLRRYFILFLFLCRSILSASGQNPRQYDVLIMEFLPDPTPSTGLPSSSFIELKNVAGNTFNLLNWSIGNGNSAAVIKKDYLLAPDSLLILCPASAASAYQTYGSALGLTGFPSLNHDAGEIILTAADGRVIHAIQYDKSWYHNELKSAGGWSLEMIDPGNPCTGSANWSASEQAGGGTPGKQNSVRADNPDIQGPDLLRSVTPDSLHVVALFSEPLDSLSAAETSNYAFSPETESPAEAHPVPPFYNQVALTLKKPLLPEQVYTLSVQQVSDCRANQITEQNSCKAGLPSPPRNQDIIFNEILFNPPPYGFDYVELYNRSSRIIDLQKIYLGGRDALGSIKDPKPTVTGSQLFFPGEYVVLTENPAWTIQNYSVPHPDKLFEMSSLPSMPDDQGTILLLNETGEILDELAYDHHWHSPLLAGEEGVSLERIQADQPTNLASNWTSAASDAGFGTPTDRNSESFPGTEGKEEMTVEPEVFSPDNDGYQDFCFIKYQLEQGGFTANISIYNIRGIPVRQLANNSTLGTIGSFRWDGLDDAQNPLPAGHYVICADLFSLSGKIKKYRRVVVLAKRY